VVSEKKTRRGGGLLKGKPWGSVSQAASAGHLLDTHEVGGGNCGKRNISGAAETKDS